MRFNHSRRTKHDDVMALFDRTIRPPAQRQFVIPHVLVPQSELLFAVNSPTKFPFVVTAEQESLAGAST